MIAIAVRPYSGSTSLSPADVAGLLRWHDVQRDTYADAGGTTPATDGGEVRRWNDQAPTPLDLVRDSTNTLDYDADGANGLPALTGNGTQAIHWPSAFTLNSFHLFMVINVSGAVSFDYLLGGLNTSFRITALPGNLTIVDQGLDSQSTDLTGYLAGDTWQLLEISYDGATLTVRVDGETAGTQERNEQLFAFQRLFTEHGFGAPLPGMLADVALYEEQLPAETAAALRATFNGKFGL